MLSIKSRREALGVSQRDIAKSIGVDVSTVTKWEAGAAAPRTALLPALADLLGCTIDELFREPQKEAPGPGTEGR